MSISRSVYAICAAALLLLTNARSEKVIYHVAIQGSTQLSCKVTHKATKKEPYLLITCEYKCPNPVNYGLDVKKKVENVYCRDAEGQTPAAIGQNLETGDDQ